MPGAPTIKEKTGFASQFPNEKDSCLKEKSKVELIDLLEREGKVLNNKKLVEKLPDRGAKVKKFYDQIQDEITRREANDDLCGKLAELSVYDTKNDLEQLEWTGKCENEEEDCQNEENMMNDALKILATHSGTEASKKKIVKQAPTEELIRPSENDAQAENIELLNIDVYAKALCDRFDANNKELPTRKKFHPHRTLLHTSLRDIATAGNLPTLERIKQLPKSNSETCTHQAEMLSLQESIVIQEKQAKTLKETELRIAEEKLRSSKVVSNMKSLQFTSNEYRHGGNTDSDEETSSTITSEEYEDTENI